MGLFLYGSVTSLAACVVDNFRENGIIAEGAFPQRERVKKKRRGVAQLVARLLWEDARKQVEKPAKLNRGVAQLVARLLWEQDAGCSNHLAPTIKIAVEPLGRLFYGDFLYCCSEKCLGWNVCGLG